MNLLYSYLVTEATLISDPTFKNLGSQIGKLKDGISRSDKYIKKWRGLLDSTNPDQDITKMKIDPDKEGVGRKFISKQIEAQTKSVARKKKAITRLYMRFGKLWIAKHKWKVGGGSAAIFAAGLAGYKIWGNQNKK